MNKKDIFKKILIEFYETPLPSLIEREEFVLPKKVNKIITLVGPRRVGKTYYFYQLIKKIKDRKKVLYFNFEDERIFPFEISDFEALLEAYFELYPEQKEKETFIFLDEIQQAKEWELFVRRIYETKRLKIFLTGSSSKLLSREIATQLRGRTLTFFLFPFSFSEFLKAKEIDYNLNTLPLSKKRFTVKKSFEEYLKFGGFPEVVLEPETKKEILSEYFSTIYFKDLIERFKIENTLVLKFLMNFLTTNVASLFSLNSFLKWVKAQTPVSKKTLVAYQHYLQEIFVFFFVSKFSYSLKEQVVNPKKSYLIDNGLVNVVAFKFSENRGHLLENLAFLELKRRRKEVFYYKDKKECDFLLKEKSKIVGAIQVCQALDYDNRQREIKGLKEALKKFNLKKGLILTENQKEEITQEGLKIEILPLYQWLLSAKI